MNINKLLVFLLFLSIFLFFLTPPIDNDIGWHMRCGEIITRQHKLCSPDQLSYYLPGYNWINRSWLFEVIIYNLYSFSSLWGLSLLTAVLSSAAFYLLYIIWPVSYLEKYLVFILIAFRGYTLTAGLRGQTFSFLFFCLTLFLLSRLKTGKKYPLYLLPLLFLIWTNLHSGFIYALLIFIFYIFEQIYYSLKIHSFKPAGYIPLILSFVLSLIATFINPYGLAIYSEFFPSLTFSFHQNMIVEWHNPSLSLSLFNAFLVFIYAVVVLKDRKNSSPVNSGLVGIFLLLTFFSVRHLPYFYVYLFTTLFNHPYYRKLSAQFTGLLYDSLQTINSYLAVAFLFLNFFYYSQYFIKMNNDFDLFCYMGVLKYPCHAIGFLKANHLKGDIFADYGWGGFIEWQYPDNKLFIDGRMPIWTDKEGKTALAVYNDIIITNGNWPKVLTDYKTDIIIIPYGQPLSDELDKGIYPWKPVFRDSLSLVYLKK